MRVRNIIKALKVLLFVILMPAISFAQDFPTITYNYKNCSLTIKEENWIKKEGKDVLPVTATLSNNSDDTLKYESELCYNGLFYCKADTNNFKITNLPMSCTKNWPITVKLAPHTSQSEVLTLVRAKDNAKELKIKFYLVLANEDYPTIGLIKEVTGDDAYRKQYYQDLEKRTHLISSNTLNF